MVALAVFILQDVLPVLGGNRYFVSGFDPTSTNAKVPQSPRLCGSCSFVCPSNIPLSQLFQVSKAGLRRLQAAAS